MTNEQQEIIDAFMSDFTELLRRHNAIFDVCEGDDYARGSVEIDFRAIYDYEKDKLVRPWTNFQLPNYINPNR
jgi:hypothetical protein